MVNARYFRCVAATRTSRNQRVAVHRDIAGVMALRLRISSPNDAAAGSVKLLLHDKSV
jgi:hypothetical protein